MSYTEQMADALYQQWGAFDDSNDDYSSLIYELNSEKTFRTFGDGLLFFLRKKKPELTAETAVRFIEEICKETGISKSDIGCNASLKSWFDGGPRPNKSDDSRRKMFALAFSLRLTPDETADLFHKVYLDRAFDCRDQTEIIYYFCLQNRKSWSDAERLIDTANGIIAKKDDYTVYTAQIISDIDSMKNESELISYIAQHGHNLEKRNASAKANRQYLLNAANETAKSEAEQPEYAEYIRGCNRDSVNFTYKMITGISVAGDTGTKTLFGNVRLPKEIKNRFPEAITLTKKEPTYEELRKCIILLFSYTFWYKVQWENVETDIEDYVSEINVYLSDSGMSPMYCGNPYDWLFLYCSLSERPLDAFRGILAEVLQED